GLVGLDLVEVGRALGDDRVAFAHPVAAAAPEDAHLLGCLRQLAVDGVHAGSHPGPGRVAGLALGVEEDAPARDAPHRHLRLARWAGELRADRRLAWRPEAAAVPGDERDAFSHLAPGGVSLRALLDGSLLRLESPALPPGAGACRAAVRAPNLAEAAAHGAPRHGLLQHRDRLDLQPWHARAP